jgi:tetratricopeptide (TPR) repeat protein
LKGLISPRFFLVAAAAIAAGGVIVGTSACGELKARRAVKDGNKLYGEGKYESAIEKFEQAIADSPHLDIAHHNCGLAHLKIFDTTDDEALRADHATRALAHFNEYLKSEPNDDRIISAMIKLYVDSGDYAGALAYWEAQLEKDPNDSQALAELATINEKALDFEAALEWHRRRYEVATTPDEKVNALNSIGMLQFRRLLEDKESYGAARLALADSGIEAFQGASELQPQNEQLFALQDALYQQRSVATEVSWGRAVEQTSALVNRLKWRDIYTEKQKHGSSIGDSGGEPGDDKPDEAER